MLIPDKRVAKVVGIMTDMPGDFDSLDTVEFVLELEEEFGVETVRLATRFIEASRTQLSRRSSFNG